MTKPTGRPPGRPKGPGKSRTAAIKQRVAVDLGLAEDQIANATPFDAFKWLLASALRMGDVDRAREVARDWAPYLQAKAVAPLLLTEDDIRRIAAFARSEASRRGYDIETPAEPAAGTMPN